MTDSELQKLLGSAEPDPGCDHSGELMDEYCELVARGEPLPDRFATFLTHMANCAACREDTEGLLAVLRGGEQSGTG
jgi:hypothetical protein